MTACCGIEMDPKDGELVCCVCERREAFVPEVGISGNHLCCGEFSGSIEGDRFEIIVCAGWAPEVWRKALDLDDLAHLRALLATADAEMRRRRTEREA